MQGVDSLDARFGVLLGEFDQFGSFGVVVGSDVRGREVPVVVGIVDAVDDTLALTGATGIPADHVEVVGDLGSEPAGGAECQRGAVGTGAAAVGEHRSRRRLRRRAVAGDVELDRVTLRVGIVDGDGECALVDALGDLRPLDDVVERFGNHGDLGRRLDDRVGHTGDVANGDRWIVGSDRARSQRRQSSDGEGGAAHRRQRMGDRALRAGRRHRELRLVAWAFMRMPPHSMMPGDKDALKGVELSEGTLRRVWTFRAALPRHDHRLPPCHPRRRVAGPRPGVRDPGDHRTTRSPTATSARS